MKKQSDAGRAALPPAGPSPRRSGFGRAGGGGLPEAGLTRAPAFWGRVAAGVVLDQATKLAVMAALEVGEMVAVIPGFLYLAHAQNPGIAFGIGSGWGPVGRALLGTVNAVIIAVVVYIRTKAVVPAGRRLFDLAMGLILAGAVGNLIDRAHPPFKVIDFIDFWLGRPTPKTWHYPTFNVADIFIVVGVAAYVFWAWTAEKRERS